MLFGFAALIVDIETAMYSMLTYLAASKTVDFILNGIEEYIGIMIVSNDYLEIKETISVKLGRGVTVFKSNSAYENDKHVMVDKEILFCVVTRLEVTKVMLEIDKIDPESFVIQYPIRDTKGGMIKTQVVSNHSENDFHLKDPKFNGNSDNASSRRTRSARSRDAML